MGIKKFDDPRLQKQYCIESIICIHSIMVYTQLIYILHYCIILYILPLSLLCNIRKIRSNPEYVQK